MRTPSSRHLSHDFPAYKGLTLRELGAIVAFFTTITSLLFIGIGIAIDFPVAMGCLGFLAGFIVAICFLPKPIALLKAGKPHGYLTKRFILLLSRWGLVKSPYVHHVGAWTKSKSLGGRDV